MRHIISRPIHAALDYIYGVTALLAPKIVGFEDEPAARAVSQIAGAGAIATGLVSKHEGGLVKVVPFNTHLKLEVATGLFYVAAPWLLGFSHHARARNSIVGLGLLELAVVALTKPDELGEEL